MRDTPEILAARADAEHARQRLMESAHELQERLAPKTVARNAWQGAKDGIKHKSADLAEDAVDAVRKRPVAATGAVAALALFLAREPLMELAGKIADGWTTKSEAKRARKRSSKKQAEQPEQSDTETA